MKSYRFLLCASILLCLSLSSFSQDDRLLVKGSAPTVGNNGIYLSYRLPGERLFDPVTGQNVGSEPFPVILGYYKTIKDVHLLGVEAGWVRNPASRMIDANGNFVNVAVNTAQLRFNYKFLPLGGDHLIEPYVGGAIVVSSTLNMEVQSFLAAGGNLQIMAGARVHAGGPFFLQVEVPYTLANFS